MLAILLPSLRTKAGISGESAVGPGWLPQPVTRAVATIPAIVHLSEASLDSPSQVCHYFVDSPFHSTVYSVGELK
jgi:hypothetical protein